MSEKQTTRDRAADLAYARARDDTEAAARALADCLPPSGAALPYAEFAPFGEWRTAKLLNLRDALARLDAAKEAPMPSDPTPPAPPRPEDRGALTEAELREALADYAHEAWSGWMRYFFEKGVSYAPPHPLAGGIIVEAAYVDALRLLMNTPYADLAEAQKDNDRAEADRMLAIMASAARHRAARHGTARGCEYQGETDG